tara:strand:+ start:1290 stop:1475 length:186 start_codon:yes stop_codon:yes gene_type:complete
MVAFATAKAKSIFSKLWFKPIATKNMEYSQKKQTTDDLSHQKENNTNYFLESIKSGGIWLS